MILVTSLEPVKTYRVFFFLLVDALRSFRVSWEGHPPRPCEGGSEAQTPGRARVK